jgi:hypothetical protein
MIVLDTDVFSFIERLNSPEYRRLRASGAQLDPPLRVAITVGGGRSGRGTAGPVGCDHAT